MITTLLMAGLLAFVLLGPTLMVAVLVSGLARRPSPSRPSRSSCPRARPSGSSSGLADHPARTWAACW